MKKEPETPLTEEYLQSLQGMREAETAPFFYSRLLGRMQQRKATAFEFKPAWAILSLSFFLTVNIFMIRKQQQVKQQAAQQSSPLQLFAETYNLNSDANY